MYRAGRAGCQPALHRGPPIRGYCLHPRPPHERPTQRFDVVVIGAGPGRGERRHHRRRAWASPSPSSRSTRSSAGPPSTPGPSRARPSARPPWPCPACAPAACTGSTCRSAASARSPTCSRTSRTSGGPSGPSGPDCSAPTGSPCSPGTGRFAGRAHGRRRRPGRRGHPAGRERRHRHRVEPGPPAAVPVRAQPGPRLRRGRQPGAVPKSLAVVGAGVIGAEYACMFAALGVPVHLIDGRDCLLPFLDLDVAQALTQGHDRPGDQVPLEGAGDRLRRPGRTGTSS